MKLSAAWRSVLPAMVLLLAAVLWVYRDTAVAMVTIWARSETFAHAFIVPPIVAWLIWRKRHELATLAPRPSPWALPALALAAAAWLFGDLATANAITQLAFVAMLVLTVPLLFGGAVARTIVFALGFAFFAVPLGEFLMPQLMEWTADFTVLALRASGIPVYREGLQFVIPSGNWSVVEACSGIRYLIASLMVGVLYAYLNYRSLQRRLIFVGIAIIVPIAANWIRAYLIVLIGHLSGNTLAVGVDHLIYGWLFFAIVIIVMYTIGARWAEPDAPVAARAVGHDAMNAGARRAPVWAIAGAAALLVLVPAWVLHSVDRAVRVDVPRLSLGAPAPGWAVSGTPVADWKPAFANAAAEQQASYRQGAQDVGLYIGYYRGQSYGHKLVSSDNVLVKLQDPRWSQQSDGLRPLTVNDATITFRSAGLRASPHPGQSAGTGLLAWQIYWVDDTFTPSDEWAKAYSAWQRLRGHGDDAAVIVVYARDDVPGGADAALASFVRANLHGIRAGLVRSRDGE